MRSFLLIILSGAAATAVAHHSRATFLLDETITLEGFVTEIAWRAPHVYLKLEAVTDSGETEDWTLEGHSIPGLIRNGWQENAVQAGDRLVVIANPNRDPEKKFALLDNVTRTDGTTFYSFAVPEGALIDAPSREPSSPSTDFSGTWRRVGSLRQALVGGFVAPTGWPLNARGQAQVDAFDLNKDPYLDCQPIPVPRTVLAPYSNAWSRSNDEIVILREHSPIVRTIHLDGSPMPADYVPDMVGYSVGRFEVDGTLVVETSGFIATRWGNAMGLDSSDQKSVTERYTLTRDGYGMDVSYTIEDPVYLVEPMTIAGAYNKVNDYEFFDVPCDRETSTRHLEFE